MNNFKNRALKAFTGGISNGEFGIEAEDILCHSSVARVVNYGILREENSLIFPWHGALV